MDTIELLSAAMNWNVTKTVKGSEWGKVRGQYIGRCTHRFGQTVHEYRSNSHCFL